MISSSLIDEEFQDTVIVGGGMAGVGAARRLLEQGRRFAMITPEIGGRVRTSYDGTINYGAYYVTADYAHTLPLVRTIDRVRITDGWFHTKGDRYSFRSFRLAKHLPALMRFTSDLRKFRKHFNQMNERAEQYSRRALIEVDPLLSETYHLAGADYIRQRRLEGLFADCIDHLLWASFFHRPEEVSTFFLLAASLPLVVPMYTFTLDRDAVLEGYREQVIQDSVADIELHRDGALLTTIGGRRVRCKNLVMATPMNVTNRLLPTCAQPIRKGIDVSYYHVRGNLRAAYQGRTRNFFHSDEGCILSKEQDGSFLYFYHDDHLERYFADFEVLAHGHWAPALFFLGDEFIDCHPAPHVYIASDHDVPSIENAYLNGRYAANLLLRQGCERTQRLKAACERRGRAIQSGSSTEDSRRFEPAGVS